MPAQAATPATQPGHTGQVGAPGHDWPSGCRASQAHSLPQPRETQALRWQMHGRGSTISRNCFVTDFPGAGSCPGGWRSPWKQPVGLSQRCSSRLPAHFHPGLGRQHRPGPRPSLHWRGLQTQAALKRGSHPREHTQQSTALHVIQAKTPWAISCIPGTVRGQCHYSTFQSKKQRFREHVQVSRLPAPDKGELEPSLVPLFA